MNNREAITLLRNLEDSLDSYCELNEEGKTAFRMAIEALNCSEFPNNSDTISRQAAIDIERNATVDTNPSHFVAHQKFTQFLDDAEISSFGRWQWSNGFNTALTAVGIDLKKLPPAQPEIVQCEDCQHWEQETINDGYCTEMDLRMCDADFYCGYAERRTDESD